jgi:hypothetical protein
VLAGALPRQGPGGDGTRFLGLRSFGPIAVFTCSSSRWGSSNAGAGSATVSAVPSMTTPPAAARLSNICLTRSMPASSSSSVQFFTELLYSTLCSRGTSSARILR